MQIRLVPALAVLILAAPALAGNVTAAGGKISWQSTQCTAPVPPPSLSNDPETPASAMNQRVADYNRYAQEAAAYMSCISNEAPHDASATSHAVVAAAQSVIEDEQKEVAAAGVPLQASLPGK